MPIVHIEQLDGEGAAHWIAFAKHELLKWDWFYEKDSVRQRFITKPGVSIRLRQIGELQYIAISTKGAVGSVYFEFGSSGFPVQTWTLDQLGLSFTSYRGCVVGVTLKLSSNNQSIEYSSSIATKGRKDKMADASLVQRSYQTQLFDEPVSYTNPIASGKRLNYINTVYTTYTPSNPYTGIYAAAFNFESPAAVNAHPSMTEAFHIRDRGYDVVSERGKNNTLVQRAVLRGNADWPRCTGAQTVTHATFGTREFVVYVDAYAVVWVFPAEKITTFHGDTMAQNVSDVYVKSAAVSFPAWAFAPSGKAIDLADPENLWPWYINSPDIAWKMNHLGTKICAVLHEREAVIMDTAYIADPDTYVRDELKTGVLGELEQWLGLGGTNQRFHMGRNATVVANGEAYTFGRGVLEVAVEIVITGANDEDYTLTLTNNVVRTPRGSDRGTFMVDYAWQDIPVSAELPTSIAAGDMLLLDIERWYQPNESIADPTGSNWRFLWYNATTPWPAGDTYIETRADQSSFGYQEWEAWLTANLALDGADGTVYGVDTSSNTYVLGPEGYPGLGWFSEPFVTGQARSFYSLRKVHAGVETEVKAINGGAVLGIDLKTAAFALALEHTTFVTRTLALAEGMPSRAHEYAGWPNTADMPHRIAHPGVAIYTQGQLRKVLTPDGAAGDVVTALQSQAALNPRFGLESGWVYMAANDLRDWTATDLMPIRDLAMYQNWFTVTYPARLPIYPDHPLMGLTVAARNWWLAGMCLNSSNVPLLVITNPNFGWAIYTSEIINRAQNVNTTFFAHPNGSWGFYDPSQIYNTYGVPDLFQEYTAENAGDPSGRYDAELGIGGYVVIFSRTYGRNSPNPGDETYVVHEGEGGTIYRGPQEPASYSQMRKLITDSAGPVPVIINTDREILFYDTWVKLPVAVNIWNDYDSLTPAVAAAAQFKHQIFDRIHFQIALDNGRMSTAEAKFADLYNSAVRGLNNSNPESGLRPITPAQQRAALDLGPADTASMQRLDLGISWPTEFDRIVVQDKSFHNYWTGRSYALNNISATDQLGTVTFHVPYDSLENYRLIRGQTFPPIFSTCLLLDLLK